MGGIASPPREAAGAGRGSHGRDAPGAGGGEAYGGWDWKDGGYGGRHAGPAGDLLLVEGAGSGAAPGAELESVLIWLEAERAVRFRRGIERDGALYLPHWQDWAVLEEALFDRDRTRGRADLIMDTTR